MASAASTPKTKIIATYLPGKGMPGVSRVISKKDAKSSLEVSLDDDLKWSKANNHRVDVTNVPEPLMERLKKDKDFRLSEEPAKADES